MNKFIRIIWRRNLKKGAEKEIPVLFTVGMQTRFCRCLRRWWTPTGAHPKWTKCCSSSSTRKTLSGCRKVNTNSFSFQLPVSVPHSASVSSFKSSLKTFLFSKTFSSVLLPWDTSECVCVCVCVCGMLWILETCTRKECVIMAGLG